MTTVTSKTMAIKTIGSQKVVGKTTTLNVHHAFLYISLPSVHDYNLKMPNFTFFLWRTRTQDNDFVFLFLNFDTVFHNKLLQKKLATFDELNKME